MGSEPQFSKYPDLSFSQDIFKVSNPHTPQDQIPAIRQRLKDAIEKSQMAPLYQQLCAPEKTAEGEHMTHTRPRANSKGLMGSGTHEAVTGIEWDEKLYKSMEAKNETELQAMRKELDDSKEKAGEQEIQTAKGKIADFYARIGDKEKAIAAFEDLMSENPALGTRIDITLAIIRIALFFGDTRLVKKTIDRAKTLVESGGDWDRRNRLKAYQGIYYLSVRDYNLSAPFLLDSLSTFTSYELCSYSEIVIYAVIAGSVSLDRVDFKKRVVDAPEIKAIVGSEDTRLAALSEDTEMTDAPSTSTAVNVATLGTNADEATESNVDFSPVVKLVTSFYNGNYARFFVALAEIEEHFLTQDRFLCEHRAFFIREMRLRGYQQFLQSYRIVGLDNMASAFGVSVDYLDR